MEERCWGPQICLVDGHRLGFVRGGAGEPVVLVHGITTSSFIWDDMLERFRKEVTAPGARRAFLAIARSLNNSQLMAIAGELEHLAIPVLIIRGERDAYLSPEISRRLHNEIPGSRLVKVATGGHLIQLDEPQLVAKTIMDHIGVRRVA